MPFHVLNGTTAPTTVPDAIGVHYINTTSGAMYQSVGMTSVEDWRMLGGFPPMNAPDIPFNAAPGSDNLGLYGTNEHWFRFICPALTANNFKLVFGGLTAGSTWSAAFFDSSGIQIGTQTEAQAGDYNTGLFLILADSLFTATDTYFIRIINHTQKFTETGTLHYVHEA